MATKTNLTLTRKIVYSILVGAFIVGFLAGIVFGNSEYYEGRFNIKGTKTTATEITGPSM